IGGWGLFAESQPSDIVASQCLALASGVFHGERRIGGQASCGGCPLDGADGVLCVPVSAGGKTFGMMQFVYGGPFGKLPSALKNRLEFDHMTKLAEDVCRTIAQHLDNVGLRRKLADESVRDPLTGLLNRRGLDQMRNGAVARIMDSGGPLAVMMMDVDEFKDINDTFGHDVGDSVLSLVGRAIAEQCRSGDITCRLGGDEFLIALPAAGVDIAKARGEAIRRVVADLGSLRADHPALNVTLSVGLAVFPDDGADWDDVTAAADAALYAAKRQGRNRIAVGPEPAAQAGSNIT
ncbi:MAG: GGDEF domain-containing protein, partial [Rhodospirillales bacterium]|nr:GGDEF domain-containing protein [Rhodospirillales bacterium]